MSPVCATRKSGDLNELDSYSGQPRHAVEDAGSQLSRVDSRDVTSHVSRQELDSARLKHTESEQQYTGEERRPADKGTETYVEATTTTFSITTIQPGMAPSPAPPWLGTNIEDPDVQSDTEWEPPEFIISINLGETGTAVIGQAINPGGNNRIWKCRLAPTSIQDPNPKLPETFVIKEFSRNNRGTYEKDELDTYKKLEHLEGITPKCYGEITWCKGGAYCGTAVSYSGLAIEFLKGFRKLRNTDTRDKMVLKKCRLAINAISKEGVLHGDLDLRNLMWDPNQKEIRVIDFEFSKNATEEWARDYKTGQEVGRPIATIQKQNLVDLESLFDRSCF